MQMQISAADRRVHSAVLHYDLRHHLSMVWLASGSSRMYLNQTRHLCRS